MQLLWYRRPRKLLVFINPYGGKKKAPDIYKKVYPLFRLASIQLDERVTQRANHARDLLLDMDLSGYDGVVGVGGDGMFSELLNGLVVRAQQDAGVNMDNPYAPLSPPSLSLGVVPAGSTDALACSVTGVNDPVSSALIIIMGESSSLSPDIILHWQFVILHLICYCHKPTDWPLVIFSPDWLLWHVISHLIGHFHICYCGGPGQRVKVDVTSIHHNGKLIRYNSSFLGYGYFGDLMAESEKFRWMGPKRYDWSGKDVIMMH
ncbi:CERK [Cordylochernes scorpioides]|uniref:CERK n=1 Tax=Cordylochernes scorpioides TaxID=51811 RepID=A0ABY6LGK1_9ARAC|nr:CERK [Cordylochernes scorpioides]